VGCTWGDNIFSGNYAYNGHSKPTSSGVADSYFIQLIYTIGCAGKPSYIELEK
jgi:hypothetical protein